MSNSSAEVSKFHSLSLCVGVLFRVYLTMEFKFFNKAGGFVCVTDWMDG